ncbi:MAG: molecular chaperone, partial [Myxococcaceae bacterium]
MRSKLSLAPLLAVVLFALSAAAENAPQAGGVQVLPTRVVFEGRERAAAITLVNNGQKAQTYRLSLVEMKMNDDGKLEPVPAGQAVDHSAAQYIRFSPRQVTLEPKTTQTVRLQLRLPAELARGEYRSHLMLRALPDVDDAISMSGADSGMQIKL